MEQEAIRSTELCGTDRLSAALQAVQDPLLAVDAGHRVYYVNEPAKALLKVQPFELPLPLEAALANIGLAHGIARMLERDGNVGDPGLTWELDNGTCQVRVQPAGEDFLIWTSPLDPHSLLQDHLGTEHMRRFWAAALAGMGSWAWDLRDDRLRSDAILEQLTGLTGGGAIAINELFDKVHPDDLAGLHADIQQARESENEVELDTQFRFRRHDGSEMWLAMRGGVIRGGDGEPIMLSGVHFDVTERKQAEQALRQAKEALQQASRAKDSFLAKVSHEIRTPLTTMLGYAELMSRRVTSEQDRRDLGEILDSGQYLQSLVDDLLDLSRIIAGKVSVEPRPVDLRHLAHELLSTMNMRAADKGLGFSLNVGPGVPSQTHSDPVRIRQVMTNLIGNAVKFTDQGEVSVRIHAAERRSLPFVAFEVRDTGPGIQADKLSRLFEPFAQTRSSDASQHGGLGLGLAISQRLAEVLGGVIEVDSHPGRGSTFTFLLPVVEVDMDAMRSKSDRDPVPLEQAVTETPIKARILAVDDVQSILSLLENYLSTAGADVTTATNGVEAMECIAEAKQDGRPFDLVLMDLHMPQMDGLQTVERLRAGGDETPVIALSASAMKDDKALCEQSGFNAFVAKPFSARQVLGTVYKVINQPLDGSKPTQSVSTGETVLVVEDNEALAELTGRQLSSLGFRVETAHTGAAAIDRAKAISPTSMLVDLTLPDMDGLSLCRALRDDPTLSDCRMIAYTGMEEPGLQQQALDAGFDDLLLKPAGLGDLAALLTIHQGQPA